MLSIVSGFFAAMAAAAVLGEHASVWSALALLFALGAARGLLRRPA